jgi:hypothetical protein
MRSRVRPTAETRIDAAMRRVIDHARSGRTMPGTATFARSARGRRKANMDASNRRSVRSPGSCRDRATTATSGLTRPTTASAALARETIRTMRESPRSAGYGKI